MKLYKIENLEYKEVKVINLTSSSILWSMFVLVLFSTVLQLTLSVIIKNHNNAVKKEYLQKYNEIANEIIASRKDTFSVEKLKDKINDLNIKFPKIVLAQAILETNHFKSRRFKEQNNLFGMNISSNRPNIYIKSYGNKSYVSYNNWEESVIDYALFQACNNIYKLKTEEEYFKFLDNCGYATDKSYTNKLKELCK